MLKKINSLLTSIPATVISGIFLVLSFILSKTDINLFFDFAWITVIISGLPLLYNAVKKLINNNN